MRRLQLLFLCLLLVICLANSLKNKTLQEIQSECKDAPKSYDDILKCIRILTHRTKRSSNNCNNCLQSKRTGFCGTNRLNSSPIDCSKQNCKNQCDDCCVSTGSSNNCCQKSTTSCREPLCRDTAFTTRQSGQEEVLVKDGINGNGINLNDAKSLNTSSSSGLDSTTSLNQTFHIANNVSLMNNIRIPVYANASSINTIHINLTSPTGVDHVQTVTKTVPIPVPRIIQTEKQVPILVPRPYPVDKIVNVDRPVPYPVAKPYPVVQTVHIPVEKRVPYPVERIVPYPQVRTITVPVQKAVPYPVPQPVPQPVPYPIERPVPYPVVHRVPVPSPCTLNSYPTQQPCCMVQPKQICTGGRCSQGPPYQSCGPHCFIGGFATTTSTGVHPVLNTGCAGLNCLYQGGGGIYGLGTLNFGNVLNVPSKRTEFCGSDKLNRPLIRTDIPWNTGFTTGGVTNYGPYYTGLGTTGFDTGMHSLGLNSGIGGTSVDTTGLTSGLNSFGLTSGIGTTSLDTTHVGNTGMIGLSNADLASNMGILTTSTGFSGPDMTAHLGSTGLATGLGTYYQNLGLNIAGQGPIDIGSTSGCIQGTPGCGFTGK